MAHGEHVRALIRGQGQLWPLAVNAVQGIEITTEWGRPPYLLVGSGTSYYLAQAAAEVAWRLRIEAVAASAGDVVLEPERWLGTPGGVIVISRSGETSEALWALKAAKEFGRRAVALVCNPHTSAELVADRTLCLDGADDATVVMIRSFTTMLTSLQAAWAKLAGREREAAAPLAEAMFPLLEAADRTWQAFTDGCRRVYILGAGIRQGIALEGALKIQEMSGVAAFVFSPLEFRHGPRGSVTEDDAVVVLGQEKWAADEWRVLTDMAGQTSRLAAIARPGWFLASSPAVGRIELPASVPDLWLGPLAVIPLQWLAWRLAMEHGADPDAPRNLTKVVEINRG